VTDETERDPHQVVEELAKRKLANRLGVRKELKRLPEQLEHGEELITMAGGTFEDGNGLIVVTDRRLIWTEQGAFKNKVEEFPFDRVATISTEKKMMSGTLKLSVSGGGRHEIKNVMPKDRVEEIAGYVRRQISPGAPAPATAPQPITPEPAAAQAAPPPQPAHDEIVARLSKLKELNEQGLLTDEEYAAKRAELIEQL